MQSRKSSDLAGDPCDMSIFKGRYFNINIKLFMCLGLWPYEIKYKIYIIRISVISTLMLLSTPQLFDVILQTEDIDRRMMAIICFLSVWLMVFKITGTISAEEKMREMHRMIASNWQLIADENEREILHTYAERARTVTIVYSAGLMIAGALASAAPSIPKILDKIMPLENPRPEIVLIQGEYFIDKKPHFTLFFCINYFSIMFITFISVVFETMYVVAVEHCCSLYAVVRSRLLLLSRIMQKNSSATEDDDAYEWLIRTIQLHKRALNFNTLVNDSYSTSFLFLLLIALIVFPLACCAMISQLDNMIHFIPYVVFAMTVLIQGFVIFKPAQRIIDRQIDIYEAASCNEWYETSLRTKKLLVIFMIRCSKPAQITAAGLLEMNLELYLKVCKTLASYATVAASFR